MLITKEKQGISLIVLVITIIVMIILAATIIVSLNNNEIIKNANEAVQAYDLAQVKTIASSIWAEEYINFVRTGRKRSRVYRKC